MTEKSSKKVASNTAIVILVLNLIIPGVGTLVAGDAYTERIKNEGVIQVVLFGAGMLLSIIFVGYFLCVGAWIWALTSSLIVLKSAGVIK